MIPITPKAWLGILGGGQLGRLFALTAKSLDYNVMVLDPDPDSPAGLIAERHLLASYNDTFALNELATCAAVTTEFENIPAEVLGKLSISTRVSPSKEAVSISQDRILEKKFIGDLGISVAPYLVFESNEAPNILDKDRIDHFLPGILKTSRFGYDGKGQMYVNTVSEVYSAFNLFGKASCILEKKLKIKYELSVILVRSWDGRIACFGSQQNIHRGGMLALTIAPALSIDPILSKRAYNATEDIAHALEYVGVLCVEFFVLEDGSLVANEMATRPHNSGHYTIDACATNQFEQQLRAMTGMPLGDTRLFTPVCMVNLLGDVWFNKEKSPDWKSILAMPGAKLCLYGKRKAIPRRKMGHINITAPTVEEALNIAREIENLLGICS